MAKNAAKMNDLADSLQDDDLDSITEFSEDIADAEAPALLPERDYRATIAKVDKRVSNTSGNPYYNIQFKINADDYPADFDTSEAPDGKTVTFMLSAVDSKPNRHRIRKFCEAIGFTPSKSINHKAWEQLEAKVTIKHDTYQGETREKISRVDAL